MIKLPKNNWRITKYNPVFRDEKGAYLKDDWISFSDIGSSFNEEILTFDKYHKVEDAYVFTASNFLTDSGLAYLTIKSLENNKPKIERKNLEDIHFNHKQIQNGMPVSNESLESICRLILRDVIWCRIESESEFYIHFGWDYYMYIGSNNSSDKSIAFAKSQNLFVEEIVSPYILNKDE